MEKHEWRKKEKALYLPKTKPEIIHIPEFQFLTIEGEGSPESQHFAECIAVLYSVSYVIKMTLKQDGSDLQGYTDYTVYPLEGIWDLNEEAKKTFDGTIDKKDFVYQLMIRQPDFLNEEYFLKMMELTKKKRPHPLLDQVKLEKITDGKCIQMLHMGSYDKEAESFKQMEEYAEKENLVRKSKAHREIYLSDFRKVPTEKLKTVLRFQVED